MTRRSVCDSWAACWNKQTDFDTYESRVVIAEQKAETGGNVHCWRRCIISNWNDAVTDVGSKWKKRVGNWWISYAVDRDTKEWNDQQQR